MRRGLTASIALLMTATSFVAESSVKRSEIQFNNGAIELAGTLLVPEEGGPHPGLVMVHGSGPGERWESLEVAEQLASNGMAVLIYDKRGSGQSSGNWIRSSIYDLAEDAAAAFGFLGEQANVDAKRLGYWGISQGGWIVPLAADMSSPAFAIVITGGGSSPREVETKRYLAIVRRIDDSESASSEAGELLDAYFGYLAGEILYDTLIEMTQSLEDSTWYGAMGIGRVIPAPGNRENWEWVATFDPKDSIEKLNIPVLVLLGGKDPLTPTQESARIWNESLASGPACSLVRVFPDAGHGMRTRGHGGEFIDGYFDVQLGWLREIGILMTGDSERQ